MILADALAGRIALALVLLSAIPAVARAEASAAAGCDATDSAPVVVAAIDDHFDLLLGDGRVASLSGIDVDPIAVDRRALADRIADREPLLKMLSGPDRWGRIRARLRYRANAASDAPLTDLAAELLLTGAGRFRPDPDAHACRGQLLAAESQAREARAGLWADPASILQGDDRAALAAAPPSLLVVEGPVVTVGEARGRVYLNLGKMRTLDLAIVILGRNISAFDAQGVELRKLAGHRIRVRGLLDRRFGPQIEITTPDALEILEAGGERQSAGARGHRD